MNEFSETADSMRTVMSTHVRDWATNKRDAWLWGIVCGWNDEAMSEVAQKFSWDKQTVARLRRYRKAFMEAQEGS